MSSTRSRSRGFTLLELIVVIVVLGVLAALAIPAFGRVVGRSEDAVAISQLEALHREAFAVAAFENRPLDYTDYEASVSDLGAASSAGVFGAGAADSTYAITYPGSADPATGATVIDVDIVGIDVGLSRLSDSGAAVFVNARTTAGSSRISWANSFCEVDGATGAAGDEGACATSAQTAATSMVMLGGNVNVAEAAGAGATVSVLVVDVDGATQNLAVRFTLGQDSVSSHDVMLNVYDNDSGAWQPLFSGPTFIDESEFGGGWVMDPGSQPGTWVDHLIAGAWDSAGGDFLYVDWSTITYGDDASSLAASAS